MYLMSKVEEFLKKGDAHLVAKRKVRDFLCEMKHDFPETDSDDRSGKPYWHYLSVKNWLDKWFGE
jgi:hypothetical protein